MTSFQTMTMTKRATTAKTTFRPKSYLALLAAELKVASTSIDKLPLDRSKAVTDFVMGMTKPGLILDGQHREFGAKNVHRARRISAVIILPGLDVSEQVFHFYVLNNKVHPLNPTELRATIGTSLTNKEIEKLYDRFKRAGVKAEKSTLTHRANTDPASPFKGLIDFGFSDSVGFLDENVMFQVISAFVDMPRRYSIIYSSVPEWTSDTHYDHRLSLFYRFWSAIRNKYPQAWEKGLKAYGRRSEEWRTTNLHESGDARSAKTFAGNHGARIAQATVA